MTKMTLITVLYSHRHYCHQEPTGKRSSSEFGNDSKIQSRRQRQGESESQGNFGFGGTQANLSLPSFSFTNHRVRPIAWTCVRADLDPLDILEQHKIAPPASNRPVREVARRVNYAPRPPSLLSDEDSDYGDDDADEDSAFGDSDPSVEFDPKKWWSSSSSESESDSEPEPERQSARVDAEREGPEPERPDSSESSSSSEENGSGKSLASAYRL